LETIILMLAMPEEGRPMISVTTNGGLIICLVTVIRVCVC